MGGLGRIVEGMGSTQKAVGVLVMVGSLMFSAGLVLAQQIGVPEQVKKNTEAITRNTAAISDLRHADTVMVAKVDRVICLLLLPDSLPAIRSEQLCPDRHD